MSKVVVTNSLTLDGVMQAYEDFASFWPNQTEDNPYVAVINNVQKRSTP